MNRSRNLRIEYDRTRKRGYNREREAPTCSDHFPHAKEPEAKDEETAVVEPLSSFDVGAGGGGTPTI